MPLFKTRRSKIEPLIATTDNGARFDNQPKMEPGFLNVTSTQVRRPSNTNTKRAVVTERMDDPEEVFELSPLALYYRECKNTVDLTSTCDSPRAFYRRSMDFCRSDFPPPPNFLPTKGPTETPQDDSNRVQDEEVVWTLKDTLKNTVEKTANKGSKWQLRDVDKTSKLIHKCGSRSSLQNSTAQEWLMNPDKFYNCLMNHRKATTTGMSTVNSDKTLKNSLFRTKETRQQVRFPPEVLVFSCIQDNSNEELEFVLRHSNIDINSCYNAKQLSPLHLASIHGYTDCIRVLLRYGANVNYLDPNGYSPLSNALSRFHFESAVLLIEAGADIGQLTAQKLREYEKVKKTAKKYKSALDA